VRLSDDRLLPVSVVARRLCVSPQTVRNWIRAGRIPSERTPTGRLRVRLSTLIALRTSHFAKSESTPRVN